MVSMLCTRAVVILPTQSLRKNRRGAHDNHHVSPVAHHTEEDVEILQVFCVENTSPVTHRTFFSNIFRRRAKPLPPCLLWHRKNSQALRLTGSMVQPIVTARHSKITSTANDVTTSIFAIKSSSTSLVVSAPRNTTNRKPEFVQRSSTFAAGTRHSNFWAHETRLTHTAMAKEHSCNPASERSPPSSGHVPTRFRTKA